MQGDGVLRAVAHGLEDLLKLLAGGDGKGVFAARLDLVKIHAEGLVEQPGQALGQILAFCDQADLGVGEGIAVEQDPTGLSQRTAAPGDGVLADLFFRLGRK